MGLIREKAVFRNKDFQFIVEIDFQLDSFREYIKITESTIENEVRDKIDKYEQFLKEASDYEIEMGHDFHDHEIKIHTHQLYYNSLFVSLYSFLERKTYQICRLAEQGQTLKVKDLSGDGISKYYKYLKKVLKINLEKLNAEWDLITKYNKLRNILVHSPTNDIEKTESNSDLIKTLRSIQHISIVDKGEFIEFEIVDKELLLSFCKTIHYFLYEIYHERAS